MTVRRMTYDPEKEAYKLLKGVRKTAWIVDGTGRADTPKALAERALRRAYAAGQAESHDTVQRLRERLLALAERLDEKAGRGHHTDPRRPVKPMGGALVAWAADEIRAALSMNETLAKEDIEPDRYEEWITSHHELLQNYRGQWVAIHIDDGVVAHGSFQEVYEYVEAHGLKDQVLLHVVPETDAAPIC